MAITVRKAAVSGPWVEADAAWFQEHPGEAWYVRDIHGDEMRAFTIERGDVMPQIAIFEHLRQIAARSDETVHVIRMAVLQVRPGARLRLPVLGRQDSTGVMFCNPDGTASTVEEFLTELRKEVADALDGDDDLPSGPLAPDSCEACAAPFRSGDVTVVFGDQLILCSACGLRRTDQPTAFTIYFSHSEPPSDYHVVRAKRRIEQLSRAFSVRLRK